MLGVLADIHGNAWALEAVLADAHRRGITRFVDLGDVLYGPMAPRRTYELLMQVNLVAQVRGNQDRFIAQGPPGAATLDWVRRDLGPEPVAWLGSLPAIAECDGWLLCHGSPASDTCYLLEDVQSGHSELRSDAAIASLLAHSAPKILCGHTHLQRHVRLARSGQLIVNPGSVGLPAYDDTQPVPHVMESYSPHARYASIDDSGTVSFHQVEYDWDAAAAKARELGRDDWAIGIATGRMS